jgi:hypothetical protein
MKKKTQNIISPSINSSDATLNSVVPAIKAACPFQVTVFALLTLTYQNLSLT